MTGQAQQADNTAGTSLRLDRLFAAQAARTPAAIALVDRDGETRFAALAAAAARMASALRAAGAQPGDLVGVHLTRSREYVTAVLGTLLADCTVLPLPPAYPAERLRDILAFAQPAAVIDADGAPLGALYVGPLLRATDADACPDAPPVSAGDDPDRAAFVLCSSGSTGRPKLIVRSHRSFLHRLHWTWRTYPYAAGETCCMKSHTTTTHAIYELFEPLLQGVPVHVFDRATARSLETFWETIRQQRVTRLLLVPSLLQASLAMPGFTAPDLRVLVLMGEYVSPALAARALAAFGANTHIHSIYGSTEASSTLQCDLRTAWRTGQDLPLGQPLAPDIAVHVLDAALEPVADGTPGMLYLSGPALFSGYLNDPALTAAALVTRDGKRLYRSNDRVQRAADGSLHYLGRSDHVIKVRGFRVDLQEVENALVACTGVDLGVVVTCGTDAAATLTAFVSPDTLPVGAITHALRQRLPDYMVPARVIPLPALPRTPSGKIDRRTLAARCGGTAGTGLAPTRNATEQALAQAWQAALGHADFGPESSFFEVGGSSLKTFAVIAQLRHDLRLGRARLPDDTLYRYPTFAALAAYLERARTRRLPDIHAGTPMVTLRAAHDAHAAPLFVIAAAGGTLGAYAHLIHALTTQREVIGLRDPWLWGQRDATAGFQHWVTLYLDAIRARQSTGPYHLLVYSSAGAFGYEIARQLRSSGEMIGLLACIDPLAMDRPNKHCFGYWALQARFMRPPAAHLIRLAGWLRQYLPRPHATDQNDFRPTASQLRDLEHAARTNHEHLRQLSALLELDTGLPVAMSDAELDAAPAGDDLAALVAKVHAAAPDAAPGLIESMATQYPLQVRAQHQYRLPWLDATLVLFEPTGPHCGLLAAQLRTCVRTLDARRVAMAPPTGRRRELAKCFPAALYPHYFCMRDDAFTQAVARQLDALLDTHLQPASASQGTT